MMLDQKQRVRRGRRAPREGSRPRCSASSRTRSTRRSPARSPARRSTPRWPSSTTSTPSGKYDTIIVDTPPTAHALDFLDAPRKLSEAIDSPAIEWFRKLQGGSGSGWSLVGKAGAFVLKRLAKFVGSQFIDDLGVFFTEFNDILGGFRKRAEETFALLRQPRVGFVLVASPEPMAVREALVFHERLKAAAMPFVGFVVNKVHPFAAGHDRREAASTPRSPRIRRPGARPVGHDAARWPRSR